jgi:predicted ferric reductase
MDDAPRPTAAQISRRALGRPSDWNLRRPRVVVLRPGLSWIGPITVVASVAVSWSAFAGAIGEEGGNVQYGLWIGAASTLLMAWSFVLALRPRFLEPFFGGLDQMYRVHRWAGSFAVVAMFLHTQAEPEIKNGIRGASRSIANDAEGLAGIAEIMLYVLVGISLVRWFPYRYWRWTHKLLGVPFVFASWHFYTAEKTYENASAWGWWFLGFMIAGSGAYVLRVIGRDMLRPGVRYRVSNISRQGSTTELRLAAVNKPIRHRVGQFAVVKLRIPGLREPHVFTIASSPEEPELRFFIRDLGDWTAKIQDAALTNAEVIIEGPYGRFQPLPHDDRETVWVAGGVGITPFLSATASLSIRQQPPTLIYCVRTRDDATALDALEKAARDGRIDLHLYSSSDGTRFDPAQLAAVVGPDRLRGAHVAICGPQTLVSDAAAAARRGGADEIETEAFDIRGGVGPDLSVTVEAILPNRR